MSTMKDYSDYLRGKRVVFVGPAGYTEDMGLGGKIDSYDVVVRVNNGIGLACKFPQDLGTRTDVLYTTFHKRPNSLGGRRVRAGDVDHWRRHKLQLIIGPFLLADGSPKFPEKVAVFEKLLDGIPRVPLPYSVTHNVCVFGGFGIINQHNVESVPSNGYIAMFHLAHQPLASLDMFGVTGYHSPYYQEYTTNTKYETYLYNWEHGLGVRRHDPVTELHAFRLLAERNTNITYDEMLHRLLGEAV